MSPTPAAPGAPGVSDPGTGAGQVPIGNVQLPEYGGIGPGTGYGTGGADGSGHTGHTTSPPTGTGSPAPSSTPTPSGSAPADGDTCEDGEVTLVQPLLGGLTEPVFGLLDGSRRDAHAAALPLCRPGPGRQPPRRHRVPLPEATP